jgi:hypothetical protein
MSRFRYLVSSETYKKYYESYNSYKIDNNSYIQCTKFEKMFKLNEIFDRKLETEYTIHKQINNITGFEDIYYLFKTKSNTEYRLDLIPIEDNTIIYPKFISVSFSLSKNNPIDSTPIDYDKLTDKNEMMELMSRILYLMDIFEKDYGNNIFMIGYSDNNKKMNIYEYLIRIVFKDYRLEKIKTDIFPGGYSLFMIK